MRTVIKEGMYVGLGDATVGLLVRVEKIDGSTFDGYVVNGDWYLRYDTQTEQLIIHNPFGAEVHPGFSVLFMDPLPMKVSYYNYNEVIHYMNEHLNRLVIVSWVLRTKHNVATSVTTFCRRVKTSVQMFVRTWKTGSTDIRYVDLDDDIPF